MQAVSWLLSNWVQVVTLVIAALGVVRGFARLGDKHSVLADRLDSIEEAMNKFIEQQKK